jgi:predicted PurR-regulated permease PerM
MNMAFPDHRTLNVLLTTLLFAVVLAIVYVARTVIVIFAFSILFAYLINPMVRFLQSHSLFFKNLRGPHVAEAYVRLLILVGLVVYGLAPQFVPRVGRLVRESPAMMESVYSGDIAVDMGHRNGWDEAQSLRAKAFLQQRRETISALLASIRQFASVAFGGIVMIPILGLFFLSDLRLMGRHPGADPDAISRCRDHWPAQGCSKDPQPAAGRRFRPTTRS